MNRRPGWMLWFSWVLVIWATGTGAVALLDWQSLQLGPVDFSGDNYIFPLTLWGAGFLLMILVLAILQTLVIYAFAASQIEVGLWLVADIIGGGLALAVCLFGPLSNMLLPGLILGSAQWFALRERLAYAFWWIPINAVAWCIGAAVLQLTTSDWFTMHQYHEPFYPAEAAHRWAGGWALAIFVFAAITGLALTAILRLEETILPGRNRSHELS